MKFTITERGNLILVNNQILTKEEIMQLVDEYGDLLSQEELNKIMNNFMCNCLNSNDYFKF